MYFAHTDEKVPERFHLLSSHLLETSVKAEGFAPCKLKGIARMAGLLHDVGKYQSSFQKKLKGSNLKIEHSHCGAIWAMEKARQKQLYPAVSYALAYCIAGHHGGLSDGGSPSDLPECGTLSARLKRATEDYDFFTEEVGLELVFDECNKWLEDLSKFAESNFSAQRKFDALGELYSFDIRMIFSSLVNADFLDTEAFCQGEVKRGFTLDFKDCLKKVQEKLSSFKQKTIVQKSRAELQAQAFENAKENADVYLMNMPTGSGKTLASLYIALYRAIKTGKKRIIYVIPYTSIIEQTAAEFEKLLGKGTILQHHSNYDFNSGQDDEQSDYLAHMLAQRSAENWDASIIITTNVQFFESIYSNRTSKLRRLHNMQDSILVFDEVHMMPKDYLAPCLKAVGYLTKRFGSEAIFLTATMPEFKELFNQYCDFELNVKDLISDKSSFVNFQKCYYQYIGAAENEELVQIATKYPNALIVVNSRKRAREVYSVLPGCKYHLSTYQTPADRSEIIEKIRKDLKMNRNIYVVSTSLVEAGVDLDFACVFREIAGLDNIFQAGGRCNREGERDIKESPVFIFGEGGGKDELSVRQNITKGILADLKGDINSRESINRYYSELYSCKNISVQMHDFREYIDFFKSKQFFSIKFKSYAEQFKMIETDAVSVVIPNTKAACDLVEKLKAGDGLSVKRRLQRYCASIFPNDLKDLLEQGAVDDFGTGLYVLQNLDYYNKDIGLKTTNDEFYFIEGR